MLEEDQKVVQVQEQDIPVNPDVEEHWIKSYWRPAMGWLYMLICAFDFIIFPMLSMVLPGFIKGMTYTPWKSITLDNGGMIHIAFGAVLGVSAWARTAYEKKTSIG